MSMTRRGFMTRLLFVSGLGLITVSGCDSGTPTGEGASPTTASDAPSKLVLGFVPAVEADKIADSAKPMADFVSKELNIPIETYTTTDYTGMIEAMGSKKADIGSLSPFAYVLAKNENAAEVILKTSRNGTYTYPWMYVARAGSGITKISEAQGKKVAFVDPSSTSGYLYPKYYLKKSGFDPDKFFDDPVFLGSHDAAVRAVYNGDVDIAAVYDDARNKVEKEFPDVKSKVIVVYTSKGIDEIPNDTISVRPGLAPELVAKIKAAFIKFAETPEGKATLKEIYEVDNFAEAQDSDYDPVRAVAKAMNVKLKDIDRKKPSPGASPMASPAATASPTKP